MTAKQSIITVLICKTLLGTGTLQAQYAERDFTHYTVKNGLSDNSVVCIQQDNRGYIWIGTDNGLNRFDGVRFQNYYSGTAPLEIFSGSIWRIKNLGPGELGITSKGGFQLIDPRNYTVRNFKIADSTPISGYLNSAWDAEKLADGSYAVTTATGFYVYNKNGGLLKRHDAYTMKDIGNQRILYGREMLRLNDSVYVVYIRENKVALYNTVTRQFGELDNKQTSREAVRNTPFEKNEYWSVRHQLSDHEFIFIRGVYNKVLYYDHHLRKTVESELPKSVTDSVSWESKLIRLNDTLLALNSGISGFHLLRINRKTGKISTNGTRYLRNFKIVCLFLDKDNRLWAGTPEGLLKQELQPPFINALHYKPVSGEKFAHGFSCVYRYKDKIYATRYAFKKGLVVIDAKTKKLIREISLQSESSNWNEIRSIEMYHPDTLWLGTNAGLLWFDTRSERYGKVFDEKKYPWGKSFYPVMAPPRPDGYAWMCSMMSGQAARYHIPTRTFTRFSPTTTPALPFEKIKSVVYDAYGDVWFSGHSLARWNNQLNRFDTLISVYGGVNKFNDDIISISADASGSLWFHNVNNGLLEYKIREKRFVAYTMRDGLPFESIYGLSAVIGEKMWISGNSQLCLYNLATHKATVYDYSDGLPEHKPTARKIYYDSQDQCFYVCCNEYLVNFPATPPRVKDRGSDLLIEEVHVNYIETLYFPQETIRVRHDQNNLIIKCSVIDFDKSNYLFAWRFRGAKEWNTMGDQRTINLNNLPPGDYSIELKASGKPGVDKVQTLSFMIRPPVWKTAWFLVAGMVLAGLLVYFLYRRRIRSIRQKAEIDQQLSQTEMKALQAQMNPHFIFNSLNSIREMILNNENKDASHYLSKFAHLIRITLDQSSQPMVSLRNTTDYLQRYLEMEKIRNSLLSYTISTDEQLDADETMVPPMLLQPFIENALWHGVSASSKAIHVIVDFRKEGDKLLCHIDDNGIGINQALKNKNGKTGLHKPHGIDNIRNRISLLNEKYGVFSRVEIKDKKDIPGAVGSGTVVTLYLPLDMAES